MNTNLVNSDHIKRYLAFVSAPQKTLRIKLGRFDLGQLTQIRRASADNNRYHRSVPAMRHIIIRSYIAKKEVSPGTWEVTAVFDKR